MDSVEHYTDRHYVWDYQFCCCAPPGLQALKMLNASSNELTHLHGLSGCTELQQLVSVASRMLQSWHVTASMCACESVSLSVKSMGDKTFERIQTSSEKVQTAVWCLLTIICAGGR